jgi:hypothetical protein
MAAKPRDPIRNAVHLFVDMQRIFVRDGMWETPWMERVLPGIMAAAELNPSRNVSTRFMPSRSADERAGRCR